MVLGFKKVFPWGEPTNFREKIMAGTKIHTIRSGNRWKPGNLIHMAYGVRTKNYEQFNKGIDGLQRVVNVQGIEINHIENTPKGRLVYIEIDGELFNPERVYELFLNDGFDNIVDFDKFFRKDFSGQIIHWTNFRYE